MSSQMRKRRNMLGRDQDVRRVSVGPEGFGFDLIDAESRTYRHIPEAIEINCTPRASSGTRGESIKMILVAFAPRVR